MNAGLEQAKLDAERARRRLGSTLGALQQRLKPSALAEQAWTGVRDKGSEMADDAVEAVKERPAATAGVVAAFLLFLARGQIVSAASRAMSGRKRGDGKSRSRKERASEARDKEQDDGDE